MKQPVCVLSNLLSFSFTELHSTAVVVNSEICEATCHYLAANDSPVDCYHQWTICLSLLKEDQTDHLFCMTYFHYLYQRTCSDIKELEALIEANPLKSA